MIARLRGRVVETSEDSLVLDVQGVGYLVYASPRLLREVPGTGETMEVVVETLVREDAITLVGFTSTAEKKLFRLLQSIQGVGARLALAVLGALEPDALARAVMAGDRAALARAPGVGPRLAQRIVSELKDRLGSLPTTAPVTVAGAASPAGGGSGPLDDAVTALAQLGYGRSEAHTAAATAVGELGETADVAALLRRSLQLLGQRHG